VEVVRPVGRAIWRVLHSASTSSYKERVASGPLTRSVRRAAISGHARVHNPESRVQRAVECLDRDWDLRWLPMMAIFGAILPRFVLLVGWANDQTYWGALFGSPILLLGGFLFLPWTTLVYGLAQANGMSILNWIFLAFALLIDLGTWGIGFFSGRKEYSAYRGT
jgi:hypothetical protein